MLTVHFLLDVSTLPKNNKTWYTTLILILVLTGSSIWLNTGPVIEQLLFCLLSLSIFVPSWSAYQQNKKLHGHNQELTEQVLLLEKRIANFQTRESIIGNALREKQAIVFSIDIPNQRMLFNPDSSEFEEVDLQQGLILIEKKIHGDDRVSFIQRQHEWLKGIPARMEFRSKLPNGEWGWSELQSSPIYSLTGELERISGIILNITNRKEREEQLAQMAFYDPLTELPNRIMLHTHLKKVLSRAKRKNHEVTIMFLDLDGFKNVNDTLGHEIGDLLLREVANRLNETVREEDLVSRLGGDEFIIVFEETSKEEVTRIAERIVESISEPYAFINDKAQVTPSIGISSFPEDGYEIETLIACADKAMYFAKSSGKNNFQFYKADLPEPQSKISLMNKLLNLFQK